MLKMIDPTLRESHLDVLLLDLRVCQARCSYYALLTLDFDALLIIGFLQVPLDYNEPSGDQAAIALIKLPSKIQPGQDGYLGPVLFNPGKRSLILGLKVN